MTAATLQNLAWLKARVTAGKRGGYWEEMNAKEEVNRRNLLPQNTKAKKKQKRSAARARARERERVPRCTMLGLLLVFFPFPAGETHTKLQTKATHSKQKLDCTSIHGVSNIESAMYIDAYPTYQYILVIRCSDASFTRIID